MVGCDLAVGVGYQCRLCGPGLTRQLDETRISGAGRRERIAFDIEFDPAPREFRQKRHVLGGDVPAIRPRVHGDAATTRGDAGLGRLAEIGFVAAPRIAQHGDLVEVDAEHGHARESSHKPARKKRRGVSSAPESAIHHVAVRADVTGRLPVLLGPRHTAQVHASWPMVQPASFMRADAAPRSGVRHPAKRARRDIPPWD